VFIYKIKNYKIQKLSCGFTLIEILVTLAMTAVAITAGLLILGGYNTGKNLKSEGDQLTAALQNARQNSIAQQNGARWGVHFSNTTSTQSYSLFRGLSYASGTIANTYALRGSIQFGNPSVSSTIDTIFNPITGYLPSPQVFTLNDGRSDGLVYDIAVSALGKITATSDTGLAGYWHFDESTSTLAYDASGKGNNGTLTNGPTWQSGASCKAGSCLNLSGAVVRQGTQINDNSSIQFGSGSFTILAWINSTQTGQWKRIVTKRGSASAWYSMALNSGKLTAEFYGTLQGANRQSVKTVNNGIWHQVVTEYDAANQNINLYIDGVLDSSFSNNLGSTSNNQILEIGTWGTEAYDSGSYTGLIDEIRVYNRALSAQEILDQYNALQ